MVWLAIVCCLAVSFVFSGIEAGILSVNRIRLRHRVKLRDRAAVKLNRLLATPERLLVTVLVVTNLMNISAVILATQELVRMLGAHGYWVALAAFLPIYLIGLELLPKSLFRRFPYRALAMLSEPLRIADLLLSPMHFVGWHSSRLFFARRPPEQRKLFVAREDFKYLTIESERTGTLGSAEREMIHNVVDFRAIAARDVMIPLAQAQTIAASAPLEELFTRGAESGFERWPVTSETGEITGLIDLFDLALEPRRRGRVESFQRRIVRVKENEPAYAVLRKLRAARATLAAVLGAGEKPVGIVSAEDLVRRLVATK